MLSALGTGSYQLAQLHQHKPLVQREKARICTSPILPWFQASAISTETDPSFAYICKVFSMLFEIGIKTTVHGNLVCMCLCDRALVRKYAGNSPTHRGVYTPLSVLAQLRQ